MSIRNHLLKLQRKASREWLGVWNVQDYYDILEKRASAGAQITYGYILMVIASAALATGGLLLDNSAVIIGSMCVAPFLGSSRAVCIGGLFRNRRLFFGGVAKQLLGLLIIGAGAAYIICSFLIDLHDAKITHEILLRSMPTASAVTLSILIAVASGAAASLALTADPHIVETPWGQIIDAVIGVEIAISLIPPASVIGIGLAFGRTDISYNAFLLLIVNVLGLDIVGSMSMLALRGIRAKYLVLEKAIRKSVESTLTSINGIQSLHRTINVTLLRPTAANIHITIRVPSSLELNASLAQSVAVEVREKTGCYALVTIEMIPVQSYSML